MKMTALKDITLTGELAYRIGRNYSRLEAPLYRPESIFHADQQGWPGDWEGRTILALSFHEDITGRKAAWLEDILAALEEEWNPQGYLKDIFLPDEVDEQQLSGHNWLLRGLLELYLRHQEPRFAQRANTIVENLYLPLGGRFAAYPTGNRGAQGGAAGHIAQSDHGWRLSTDVGCAFISMDALAQHHCLFGGEALRALLWEMFDAFRAIDPVRCQLQTHATLSALRGILRFYETERDPRLLHFAQERFDLYCTQGMTPNYANYNWFGRPLWTEPCAIVDSMMVAVHLFRYTGEGRYIALANRIFYNGLLASQRPNGGFGCDLCAGTPAAPQELRAAEGAFEAYWCCSMRGAEGLTFAAAATVMQAENRLYITAYHPGTYRLGEMTVIIQSRYPRENRVRIAVNGPISDAVLHLYLPEDSIAELRVNGATRFVPCRDHFLEIPLSGEVLLDLSFVPETKTAPALGALTLPGTAITQQGDLILATGPKGPCYLCDRMYQVPEAPCTLTL